MSVSSIQPAYTQHSTYSQNRVTRFSALEVRQRSMGPDTVSLSEEAVQLAHAQKNATLSGSSSGSVKSASGNEEFLEKYQVPSWLVEASSPHCLYRPTLPGEGYTGKPASADAYDNIVSDAFIKALQDNGIDMDNYYDDFIKNPVMNEKVKKDMYAYLQQNPKAMKLMQTWNPDLLRQLS